jgi:hypothetical protein
VRKSLQFGLLGRIGADDKDLIISELIGVFDIDNSFVCAKWLANITFGFNTLESSSGERIGDLNK